MGAKRARLGWNAGKGGEVTYVDAAPSGTLLVGNVKRAPYSDLLAIIYHFLMSV